LVYRVDEISASRAFELKELIGVLDDTPFVRPAHLEIAAELAEASAWALGGVISLLLPTGLHEPLQHEVRAVAGATEAQVPADRWTDAAQLSAKRLELWRKQGLIRERFYRLPATITVLKALRAPDQALSGKPQAQQRRALEQLWQYDYVDSAAQLARDAGVSESSVRSLVKKGYAAYVALPAPPPPLPSYPPQPLPAAKPPPPEADAFSVMGGTRAQRLSALLPVIQATLNQGRSVLVLAPESYILSETASYLSDTVPVFVLHGELSDAQRLHLWEVLRTQERVVLIGTYLALLAPLPTLGRLIVLEEGSASYKLQSGPRFFIPSVAQQFANRLGLPIHHSDVLLTAETLHTAKAIHHLPYPGRRVYLSDLSERNNWPLGSDLIQVLKQVETRRRQAVVLAPRRGFSAALGCHHCSYLAMCPNCDLTLRYHQRAAKLRCHQCNYQCPPPQTCPECGSVDLGPMRGAGSEWLLREIRKHVQALPLFQYDADHRDDLSPLLEGEPGIVIATSALLRHPPLPNVSLIALALVDTLFTASDFRAEEETLRLLLQLPELSEKARPLTLLQTFQAHHPLLMTFGASNPDDALTVYLQSMLDRRRHYRYPPFTQLVKIQVTAKTAPTAEQAANWLANALKLHIDQMATEAELLGPSPAAVARLRGVYNYQLFVKAPLGAALSDLLTPARAYVGRAKVRIDIDPRDIGEMLQ
jgi:primosomal protein N' (replication factor Y)